MVDEFSPAIAEVESYRRSRIVSILTIVGGIALFGMMLYVSANILMRKGFQYTLPASLEVSEYWLMPLIAAVGFVTAQIAGQHLSTDLMWHMFPKYGQRWMSAVINLLCAIVLLAAAWFTWLEALGAMERGRKAGVTEIPSWPINLMLPFFLAATAAFMVLEIRRNLSADQRQDQHD